ncbi:putative Phox domain, PX domain superfamily protein [Plasmopara halstedii]
MTPPDFLLRVPPLKLHVRNATQTSGEPAVFELFCRLNKAWGNNDNPADAVQWSLWKTYEEFQAFDNQMRAVRKSPFSKMMVTVAFAPGHRVRAFFHQDQTSTFLEKRRAELDFYMQRVMLFPDATDFSKCGSCKVLADFIDAKQYMDCSGLLSPSMGSFLSSRGIQRSSSSSVDRASLVSALDNGDNHSSRRKMYRIEIEEELTLRGGPHQLKRFRKCARAFRKENDPVAAAKPFVEFLQNEYETEFAQWILKLFVRSIKSTEKREALCVAGGILGASVDGEDMNERKARQNYFLGLGKEEEAERPKNVDREQLSFANTEKVGGQASDPAVAGRLSRKKANRQILERVNSLSNFNAQIVCEFKQAAKALGNHEMSGQAFVDYVRSTFGEGEAEKLLLLVVESVPQPQVQRELRLALAK